MLDSFILQGLLNILTIYVIFVDFVLNDFIGYFKISSRPRSVGVGVFFFLSLRAVESA